MGKLLWAAPFAIVRRVDYYLLDSITVIQSRRRAKAVARQR
jgi:hypothetical protein